MINAAIVGLGRWGRRLVDSIQENGRPKSNALVFASAVSGSYERARNYATEQRLNLARSLDEVLRDRAIQAIVLATPHELHSEQIKAAAKAHKHIFVEKPLTVSRESAEAAVDAAQSAGCVLAVGFNRRFLPASRALKALIADGALGTFVHMEGNFSGNFGLGYQAGMWRSREIGAAGAMTAMGIHIADMFIYLAGFIDSVSASGVRRAVTVDMDDAVSVTVRFRKGASGCLSTVLATPRHWRVQAFGTKAWAHMRDHHLLDVCGEDGTPKLTSFDQVDDLRLELEAFAAAIEGRADYPVRLDEAVHGVGVVDAIVKSAAANGALVRV
jgi:predicted dehydrogenase